MLSTVAVERLGIPKVHVTDGPNGARGNSLPGAGGAFDLYPLWFRHRRHLGPGSRARPRCPRGKGST